MRIRPYRRNIADLARELRAVKTPSLTVREKNQAIRAALRLFARGFEVEDLPGDGDHNSAGLARPCSSNDMIVTAEGLQCSNCLKLMKR